MCIMLSKLEMAGDSMLCDSPSDCVAGCIRQSQSASTQGLLHGWLRLQHKHLTCVAESNCDEITSVAAVMTAV